MKQDTNSKSSLNPKLAALLSLSVSLLLTFFMFARFFFEEKHARFEQINDVELMFEPSIYHIIIFFIGSLVTFFLMYVICFWFFRKKISRWKKHVAAFSATFFVASLMSYLFLKTILQFSHSLSYDLQNLLLHIYLNHVLQTGFAFSLFAYISTLFISSFIRNQQTRFENQRLIAENIRYRHEALKNQLNPHFLFNSLNTLDGLIGFDDEKAHNYIQNLSSIFRYTIQHKDVTLLKDELHFVEAYAYLMKIRYGDNMSIQYAVDEKYNNYHILSLSLQLLIENVVKHNVIDDRHPLMIRVETTENESIIVSNLMQPKLNVEAGEGIGLANLVERYRLLFDTDVVIAKDTVFSVEIPLINQL